MAYEGWMRLKVWYHGHDCRVLREESWFYSPDQDILTNADFLDEVKEVANPARKNGRVKSVHISLETWQKIPGYVDYNGWWPDFHFDWER